jgi:hypothetical protein
MRQTHATTHGNTNTLRRARARTHTHTRTHTRTHTHAHTRAVCLSANSGVCRPGRSSLRFSPAGSQYPNQTLPAAPALLYTPCRRAFLQRLVATPRCNASLQRLVATPRCKALSQRLGATPRYNASVQRLVATPCCIASVHRLVASPRCIASLQRLGATPRCIASLQRLVAAPCCIASLQHPSTPHRPLHGSISRRRSGSMRTPAGWVLGVLTPGHFRPPIGRRCAAVDRCERLRAPARVRHRAAQHAEDGRPVLPLQASSPLFVCLFVCLFGLAARRRSAAAGNVGRKRCRTAFWAPRVCGVCVCLLLSSA